MMLVQQARSELTHATQALSVVSRWLQEAEASAHLLGDPLMVGEIGVMRTTIGGIERRLAAADERLASRPGL